MGSKSSGVKGYKYYLGMHMILCHGPIDKITHIYGDDNLAWAGPTTGGTINIEAENLYGGEDSEGGISGFVDIEMGESSQEQNDYLMAKLGADVPFYRGVVGAVLRQVYMGMNPYLKTWKFRATRQKVTTGGGEIWYSAKSAIGDDMNPAHIIYECLTDTVWGMGYNASDIDEASFISAADTLYSEGLGISLIWDAEKEIQDFLNEITRHIDASIFIDNSTGKFVLKLVRDDYNTDDLLVLDESNIVKVKDYKRPLVGELVNSVTVNYWDADSGEDSSLTVQDTALIQTQGTTISTTIEYPGFTNGTNAAKAATRDLRALSFPIFTCTIHTDRTAAGLEVGDPFIMSWPDYGITEVVMRVTKMAFGGQNNSQIAVYATQDVFSIGDAVVSAPPATAWTKAVNDPAPITIQKMIDIGYWDLYQLGGTDFLDKYSVYTNVGLLASKPTSDALSFKLWFVNGSNITLRDEGLVYAPTALIAADVNFTDTTIQISNGNALNEAVVGSYAFIDDEIVRIDTVTDTYLEVGRGCLDTVPAEHFSGARVYFGMPDVNLDANLTVVEGEVINYRLTSVTLAGGYDVSNETTRSHTVFDRVHRPYPPGNLKLNGAAYPDTIDGDSSLSITWSHRDRLLQISETIQDTTADDIGPEEGVTYTVGLYDADDNKLISVADISGKSQTFNTSYFGHLEAVTVKLKAIRDDSGEDVESWQEHIVPVSVDGTGGDIYGAATTLHIFDGEVFLASSSKAIGNDGNKKTVTIYYSSADGKKWEYLGTSNNAVMTPLKSDEWSIAKGDSFYLAFPRYYNDTVAVASAYYTVKTDSFSQTWPPVSWEAVQPIPWSSSGTPLCVAWDSSNSRFVFIATDKTVRATTDGETWVNLGTMSLPAEPSPWVWYKGQDMRLFKRGSYWYLFHAAGGYQYQANSVQLMYSTDLLHWGVCPGAGFYSSPSSVTDGWDGFAPYAVAENDTAIIITARAARDDGLSTAYDIILRSTDGINFDLVGEYSLYGYNEAQAFGTSSFIVSGASGALISTDDGATWAFTSVSGVPQTRLRSDGSNLIANRKTASIDASTLGDEPYYSTDGTTWTKADIVNYNDPGARQYWRARVTIANDEATDVSFVSVAFYEGATVRGTDSTAVDFTNSEILSGDAYVSIDLGSAYDIDSIEITVGSDTAATPSCLEFEYSDDGTTWLPCWFAHNLGWSADETQTFAKS